MFKLNLNYKNNLQLLQILTIILLLASLSLEMFLNVKPCYLCLWQRFFWLVFILFTIIFTKKYLIIIPLIINTLIAGYQVAMQKNIIAASCPINLDFTSQVSCEKIDFVIFGLSLAEINAILCIIVITYIVIFYNKK